MAAQTATPGVRDQEIAAEQAHLYRVYRRLEEKIHEAEFLMTDAAQRGQVGTPGALAERDAQVFRAGIHLNRLNSEFEDFLFGRIDLLRGKDGKKGADGAFTSVDPSDDAIREDATAAIAETLHIGRIGVLDADYAPLVIDWRAPAAAPFYRSTPVAPGRVVRRRVIRSRGAGCWASRTTCCARNSTTGLPVIGDGALMAALGQAPYPHHARHRLQHPGRAGPGDPRPRRLRHRGHRRPRHRQDRGRPAPGRVPALPGPAPLRRRHLASAPPAAGSLHRGRTAVARRGGPGRHPRGRLARRRRDGRPLRRPGRGPDQGFAADAEGAAQRRPRLSGPAPARGRPAGPAAAGRLRPPPRAGRPGAGPGPPAGARRHRPGQLLRPRARRLLLDALWRKTGRRFDDSELAAEERQGFDEDIAGEQDFLDFMDAWWPVLEPAGCWPRSPTRSGSPAGPAGC